MCLVYGGGGGRGREREGMKNGTVGTERVMTTQLQNL